MATEVLNSGHHGKSKKTRRARSKNRELDEEEPLSPRDEMKLQSKAAFDEFLKDALVKSQDIDGKSKKKKKKVDEQVLESLRKGDGLRKEKDNLLDANTFDPDDTKTGKSNKRRQKERDKGQKGKDNEAFDKDEIITTKKGKKKTQKDVITNESFIDKQMSISELATSPTKEDKKKKKKKKEEDIIEEPKEEELSPPPSDRKKKKKKKNIESDLEEYQEHLKHQEEAQSEANTTLGMERDKLLSQEEEDIDDPDTARKKKKKKKTNKPAEPEIEAETAEPVEAVVPVDPKSIEDEGRILGITVHRTDKLKTDFWMAHPLVRITLVDLETGHYVKKQHKERAVASFFENENEKVDFVLPIMTQPFDFKQNKSTLPLWEEMVILNENYNYLISQKPNVIAFFELMDFVTMNAASQKYQVLKTEGGWHRIAWGFLKLVGANHKPNTDKKVRLQLYQPPTRYRTKPGSIEVYQWWKGNLRAPYPSTLYITMKGIRPPDRVEPSARSMFATQKEQGKESFDELQKSMDRSGPFSSARGKESARLKGPSLWSRMAGQLCKIPNCICLSLPTGKNGCFVVKFSHDGKSLACACHDKDGYVIYIYEIPDGKLRGQIQAHFSLIYDLSWARGDKHIVSASADGTARVWDTVNISNTAVKTLPHPSFVYTAKFHPRVSKIIVTGGYDRIIRVWTVDGDDLHGQLLLELDGHMSFVNCVCFDDEGKTLYSGDSLGVVYIWNVFVTDKPSSNGLLKEWTQNKKIEDPELQGVCISSIKVHPNGRRLLVHCRDNSIRMIDLRIGAIMQRYIGALNFREHIRSTMSPCGTFVAAGSEDCCAYIWNTETGDQVAMYSDLGYKSPVCDVDFHTQDNMIAFCSFSENSPVLVYKYDHRGFFIEPTSSDRVAQHNVGIDDDLFKRARSPDLKPGFDIKSDDEGLDESRVQASMLTEDLRVHDVGRMDRVSRKLQSLNSFKSFRPISPELPHSMPRAMSPTMGGTFLGTTFDSTGMYTRDSRAMAFLHINRPMESPEPGMFSPHASRPSTAALEQQQQFAAQSQYMRSSQSGWRPTFSEIGRTGRNASSPVHFGRPPQLSVTATQLGKPQFSFQGKTKKSEVSSPFGRASPVQLLPSDTYEPHVSAGLPGYTGSDIPGIHSKKVTQADVHAYTKLQYLSLLKVVALYDYQSQRSDELSFIRGDEITVLYKDNESWWMGELEDGQQGFFPANYVAGYDTPRDMPDILPEYKPKAKEVEEQELKPKVTAVKMRSGELKFISGAEDSDMEAPVRSKKKTRKSRDTLSIENEDIPMSSSRQKHRKSRYEESTA